MSLCFIEPQEAIRVMADAVGKEARRQLLGEVVRAWVDEIPEDELRALAAGVSAGRFEPTAKPHRGLCADCPGRPALCSWDDAHTLAEESPAA